MSPGDEGQWKTQTSVRGSKERVNMCLTPQGNQKEKSSKGACQLQRKPAGPVSWGKGSRRIYSNSMLTSKGHQRWVPKKAWGTQRNLVVHKRGIQSNLGGPDDWAPWQLSHEQNRKKQNRSQQVPTSKAVDQKSAPYQRHSLAISPPGSPAFNTRVKIDQRKPELCLSLECLSIPELTVYQK